jgi:hypothetical protein
MDGVRASRYDRFMLRATILGLLLSSFVACTAGTTTTDPIASGAGSSSSTGGSGGGNGGASSAACADVGGTWTVKNHCDPTLVGQQVTITQSTCALTFSSPFDGFTASVDQDDKVSVSGPQTCTGTASHSTINLTCTPGTCVVKLTR